MEEKKNVHLISITVEMQYNGTLDEAKAYVEELEDNIGDLIERDTYCGEPECCGPIAPLSGYVSFALASRTIEGERETTWH